MTSGKTTPKESKRGSSHEGGRTSKQEGGSRETLIVDGYNVLRSSGLYPASEKMGLLDFEDYSHDHRNTAREALINDIAVFALRRFDATVVFDGAGNPASLGTRFETAGVGVVFSAAGVSADATIEELVHKAVADGRTVMVISSDANLQWTVLGKQVTRMSAAGFADEIQAIKKAAVDEVGAVAGKNTLAERLDEDTRSRLARMARGQRT